MCERAHFFFFFFLLFNHLLLLLFIICFYFVFQVHSIFLLLLFLTFHIQNIVEHWIPQRCSYIMWEKEQKNERERVRAGSLPYNEPDICVPTKKLNWYYDFIECTHTILNGYYMDFIAPWIYLCGVYVVHTYMWCIVILETYYFSDSVPFPS